MPARLKQQASANGLVQNHQRLRFFSTRETAFALLRSANLSLSHFSSLVYKNVFLDFQHILITTDFFQSPETMSRPLPKHSSCSRYYVITVLAGILGAAVIADFLFASTSSSSDSSSVIFSSISASSSALRPSKFILVPVDPKDDEAGEKADRVPERVLSATFADIPAPNWTWEQLPSSVPRLDAAAVQIGNSLYVFAGYGTIDYVHSHVDVFNMTDNTWCERFNMPKDMANSHLGMVTDGRYVYIVAGQHGPQCRAAVPRTLVLDTKTKKWGRMPPLPAARYAPATQLWRGRLHVMGGSKENRHTPGTDHWSLAVKDGKALEKEWRKEIPIPRGGPHRSCVVVEDRLYVIGGQEGDFMAKPGSPIFKCSRRHEVVYADVYMLDGDMKWKNLPPMPKPDSHIEFSWVVVNNSIIIVGGTTEKHPVTKRMLLVGEVFRFDLLTLKWSVIGKLPFRCKTTIAGYWNGWLYFTSGQRDRGPDNPLPKKVIGEMWRTKLTLE
ncbi:unnamed protein product [Rhodiola kirilowii]